MLASIPSPSDGTLDIGPLALHGYGLLIALGVVAAVSLASRRWQARGGNPAAISRIAVWAVPGGLVGARIYHVITDNERYSGRWLDALHIWEGGLGIWGGVAGGVLVGVIVARREGLPLAPLFDVVAPAIPLAQAIGRWGNYLNQELFGRPTTLPWGLEIDPGQRPTGFEEFETFHPTFLYESLWLLAVVGILLLVEKRVKLRPGHLFALYVALYTFARFWIEGVRIDEASQLWGWRVNEWVSIVVCGAAVAYLVAGVLRGRRDREPAAVP